MKQLLTILTLLLLTGCAPKSERPINSDTRFITIEGPNLIAPSGEKFYIRGTNLGNWLNPEGYMFGFQRTNSAGAIDLMLRQLVGPDFTDSFWQQFKEHYVTEADIDFLASTGLNTLRVPFHYKLFTDEDYLGLKSAQDGFERIDRLVEWCCERGIYLILDMHDAPGGQTGDNIDDSYGYPWLLESEQSQALYASIWRRIAERYCDEPVILGYDLLNEPIAPYFENQEALNSRLRDLYRIGVEAIREVDRNHIILLGGAQWNSNFAPLEDTLFDPGIMYTCHRYGGETTKEAIGHFIDFRDRTNRPMYMGEIGHNTDQWQAQFCQTMQQNNIGYTFWPYKKISGSCFAAITPPEGWELIIRFAEAPRGSYEEIRTARPDQAEARRLLEAFIEACKWEHCTPQSGYIRSIGLHCE